MTTARAAAQVAQNQYRLDAHHVQQIPAPAAVLPFARVGVHEVAPEQKAGDFVVKANAVVARANGARLRQLGMNARGKVMLGNAVAQAVLGDDAGNQTGLGVGQVVAGDLAVPHHGFGDFVEFGIGADAGKLRRTVVARLAAKGFVVVPEKGVGHGPGL